MTISTNTTIENTIPKTRLISTDYNLLINAIASATETWPNIKGAITISVRKFLEYLDKNDPIILKDKSTDENAAGN